MVKSMYTVHTLVSMDICNESLYFTVLKETLHFNISLGAKASLDPPE